jgi:myo-inositol-hexaphosphate 3-phosphohydrolase
VTFHWEIGELSQVEGMVVAAGRGFLYAAQADVGFWRIPVGGRPVRQLFDRTVEFGQPYTRTFDPDEGGSSARSTKTPPGAGSEHLAVDAEGLTIYRLAGARGYLLGSNQGSSTFVVYDLGSLKFLPTFAIGDGATDRVDESDGAVVSNVPLGTTFAQGLLVTHDGDDEPFEDATNLSSLGGRTSPARSGWGSTPRAATRGAKGSARSSGARQLRPWPAEGLPPLAAGAFRRRPRRAARRGRRGP